MVWCAPGLSIATAAAAPISSTLLPAHWLYASRKSMRTFLERGHL